jgi:hypothetical protein
MFALAVCLVHSGGARRLVGSLLLDLTLFAPRRDSTAMPRRATPRLRPVWGSNSKRPGGSIVVLVTGRSLPSARSSVLVPRRATRRLSQCCRLEIPDSYHGVARRVGSDSGGRLLSEPYRRSATDSACACVSLSEKIARYVIRGSRRAA